VTEDVYPARPISDDHSIIQEFSNLRGASASAGASVICCAEASKALGKDIAARSAPLRTECPVVFAAQGVASMLSCAAE
jgi:hypothetical protein